jgi:hypothetical protein
MICIGHYCIHASLFHQTVDSRFLLVTGRFDDEFPRKPHIDVSQ